MPEVFFAVAQIEEIFWARPLSTLVLVGILAGIILLSLFLYRRAWGLPLWFRVMLAIFRGVALAVVIATLLEPTAVVTETQTYTRSFPVLLDISESMSMRDQRKRPGDIVEAAAALGMVELGEEGDVDRMVMALDSNQRQVIANSSRLDLGEAALIKSGKPTFGSLGESLDVSYHVFEQTPRLISDAGVIVEDDFADLKASGAGTSIATSLEAVVNRSGSSPAGIVLFSDGIDNTSSQRAEAILQDLGARSIPVYTVPLGLSDPDDVSIRNIVMQEVAFSGDRVPIRVHLESKGYERRTARLSVHLNGRRVSQRTVRFEGGLQFEDIDFRVDVYEKGAAQILIKVEPFDDEVSIANNEMTRSIRVVNEKVNVLYIEGNARWEFRYLRAILKRDPRINATFIASNVGPEVARNSPEHIERFPSKREEAFSYDLVILGDVDAGFFAEEELELLEELIRDRGASLLMLCGPMHSPGSYEGTPVKAMLPVQFDPNQKWGKVSESVYPVLTPEGRSSQVMTLENEDDLNDRIWSRMAPMDQLPPLLSAKPGATVLAVLSDSTDRDQSYPLVAWQRYGTGKCMSIASDRLWRLRFKTGDKYHWRVWSQCIQFMTLSRLMGEHKRIRLETDRSSYAVGSQGRIYAQVLDNEFDPVVQSGFEISVNGPDDSGGSQRIRLQPDRSRPGLYEGYFSPPGAGRYRVEANEDDQENSNTTEFQVTEFRQELIDTGMRPDHLQRIADLTGGAKLGIRELPRLASLVNADPVSTTVRSERPLWDSRLMILLIICILGAEWIIRRRHDLP